MNASEVLEAVQCVGGSLISNGERIRYALPRSAIWLIDELVHHREEVLNLLKSRKGRFAGDAKERVQVKACDGSSRLPFADSVGQWLLGRCVVSWRCASNPHILHREYCRWARTPVLTTAALPYEAFISALRELGWRSDEDGMIVGLCLGADFLAAIDSEGKWPRQIQN
jgi:hypothetical protein